MAKAAILLPYEKMTRSARVLVREYSGITPICVEYCQTEEVAALARALESEGCELIIARGVQASLIKQAVKLPVVEIIVTSQELATTLMELKAEVAQPCPQLALIGFANMFGDTSQFDRLFDLHLRRYMVDNSGQLAEAVIQAQADGCVGVVGGDIVCQEASRMELPNRFIPSGDEALRIALATASRVGYAIDLEKHDNAEINAMLNYTFSGIIRVDRSGIIRRANRVAYNLLNLPPINLLERPIQQVLPGLTENVLQDALNNGKEQYAFLLDINHKAVVINIAPIEVDENIEGAILTFQEGHRIVEMDSELRQELYQRGYIARNHFSNFICESKEAKETVRLAKKIARFDAPVLIVGERGVGKEILAQCIHNESLRSKNAFITIDCSAWQPETLDNRLFGNYSSRRDAGDSLAELAQEGTLYLNHIEALPPETQYKILKLIRGQLWHNGSNRPVAAKVRVIASSDINLMPLLEKGTFRADLYYALSVLKIELLPLRRRREDISAWFDFYLDKWQETHKRYVHLTQGAVQFLQQYDWPGNLEQIDSLCERIVLLTEKRNIDETFLRAQLELIAPKLLPGTDQVVLYKDQKAVEIAALLKKYNGRRDLVAQELGVSKTTLWRYIKKYGIEKDFSY